MSTSELTGINHRARGKALKTTRNLDLPRLDQIYAEVTNCYLTYRYFSEAGCRIQRFRTAVLNR